MTERTALLDELRWRGMLAQHSDGLPDALAKGALVAYSGFDPTASSLHVGNLVPILGLVHLQRHGHRPIALVGGGTGMIGDPSGKTVERQLLSPDEIAGNTRAIRGQLERFLDFDGPRGALMRDNADWLLGLGAVPFMRDVGKHFSVNYMLAKESVQSRLEGGISYTEFSYMLLQAYDYLELNRRDGVTLQVGGTDQWGNITAGMELIRRTERVETHALTFPLVTTAAGIKFGKTEAGSVWLDPARTSPYRFFQFWLGTDDRDVPAYLRLFTLLSREEVEALDAAVAREPEQRAAQLALARDVTTRLHGAEATRLAEEVSAVLFGTGEPARLSAAAFDLLRGEAPFVELPSDQIAESSADGAPTDRVDVLKLFRHAGIAASNGAARRLLEQGGVSVNKRRLDPSERFLDAAGILLAGRHIVLGKGRREFVVVRVR